jgi:hypothetical protein
MCCQSVAYRKCNTSVHFQRQDGLWLKRRDVGLGVRTDPDEQGECEDVFHVFGVFVLCAKRSLVELGDVLLKFLQLDSLTGFSLGKSPLNFLGNLLGNFGDVLVRNDVDGNSASLNNNEFTAGAKPVLGSVANDIRRVSNGIHQILEFGFN